MDPKDEHWPDWNVYADSALTALIVCWTWTCHKCGKLNTTKRDRGNMLAKSQRHRAGDDYDIEVKVRCGKCHDTTKLLHWPRPKPKGPQ